jgi:predicted TIM-barrel fold metal-dependent hydrolase
MIVDTHVHVVSGDPARYPVLDGAPDWPVTEVERLVASMDVLSIDRALLVQTFFTYGVDNSYMIDAAARFPDRFATVCVIDQTAPQAPDVLTNLVQHRGVRGLRLMPKGHPPGVLSDPRTFPVWKRAQELGIVVTVAAELEHLAAMPALVERFPDVRICFEHMWGLDVGDPPYSRVRDILQLARFPNVSLKLCPNNSHAARVGRSTPEKFFGMLVEHFGVQRMMWGSNYPAHPARFGDLAARLRIMQEDFSFLDAPSRSWFFGDTALQLWPMLRSPS